MDRLSGLPDDVIGDILSFLPTIKSLVETSTLAKSWRLRWAHFTRTAYYRETLEDLNMSTTQNNDAAFHRGSGATDSEFESWIFALRNKKNVRKLVIHLDHHLKLPQCLFASENLVDLCLVNCGCIATSVAIDFPALKKLQLKNVVYENNESLTRLLSRCPVLEEMIVQRMMFSVKEDKSCFLASFCNVSSPTLTRLVLDLDKVTLVIDTPALNYLRLRLCRRCAVKLDRPLRFLIEADIDMSNEEIFFKVRFSDKSVYTQMVKRFVNELRNVKCLTLSTRRIEWFSPLTLDAKFHNLTELKLSADWQFVTGFLVNADNLRLLTICRTVDPKAQHWIEPKPLPNCWSSHIDETACLNSHLERVIVVDFGWSKEQEFDMISYILRHAKVLKTMEILYTQQYDLDPKHKLEAHNKLLALFERGSEKCQLVFL